MRRRIERMIIRWALRRLQMLDMAHMHYGTLARYGIEDIIQSSMGEDAYVLTPIKKERR
jgi:hypothetical protein